MMNLFQKSSRTLDNATASTKWHPEEQMELFSDYSLQWSFKLPIP